MRPDDQPTEQCEALEAADVIEQGVKSLSPRRPLEEIAYRLEDIARQQEEIGAPYTADYLRREAAQLRARHDHGDPCDDERCPCRAAADKHWRDHGARTD